jgi:hypothetical protein
MLMLPRIAGEAARNDDSSGSSGDVVWASQYFDRHDAVF